MTAQSADATTGNGPGHVFVIQGLLDHLSWDAVIVPTDLAFTVTRGWFGLLGTTSPRDLRPAEWSTKRAGRADGRDDVWFLDVARGSVEELGDALAQLLDEVAAGLAQRPGRNRRARPLLALPTLGTGSGGFDDRRGDAIRVLLSAAEAVATRHAIDVVLVARERAAFAAFQAVRRAEATRRADPVAAEKSLPRRVGRLIRHGEVALVIGAGVSASAGLPTWAELLDSLAKAAGVDSEEMETEEFKKLDPLDVAELLAGRLAKRSGGLPAAVVAALGTAATTGRHGISHALLAGFQCRETVTTNFDLLFEQAVTDLSGRDEPAIVLPSDRVTAERPWLLKMHGTVTDPASIVLTRGDFVRFAGRSSAVGAVLQNLMLTRHLLVVGASLADDNVLRLIHEVNELRRPTNTGKVGTVLTLWPTPVTAALHEQDFQFESVSAVGTDVPTASRQLEIELDLIGMYACGTADYLLDPTFVGMLNGREKQVAEQARELARSIAAIDSRREVDGWRLLGRALEGFGTAPAERMAPPKTPGASP